MPADDKENHQPEDKLTTNCQAGNYLLKAYVTKDVISDAKGKIVGFKLPLRMIHIYYAENI